MQRLLKLKKVLKNSLLLSLAEGFKAAKAAAGKFRPLSDDEIAALEKNGNRCGDWSRVQVEANFTCDRIHNSVFMGDVRLPAFYGTLLLPGDVSFPTGIYDCMVHDCVVENALLYKVAMLSKVLVRSSAVIYNVGSLVSSVAQSTCNASFLQDQLHDCHADDGGQRDGRTFGEGLPGYHDGLGGHAAVPQGRRRRAEIF